MTNRDHNASREAMMMQVRQAAFAAFDAHLYLDTHPCDTQALQYFYQMREAARNAREAFEAQYGPLTANAANDTNYWAWVSGPWPWEGGTR
jgi:spore coat protein JB